MLLTSLSLKKCALLQSYVYNNFFKSFTSFNITKKCFSVNAFQSFLASNIGDHAKLKIRGPYAIMNETSHKYCLAQRDDILIPLENNAHDMLIEKLNTQFGKESRIDILASFEWLSNYVLNEKIDISSNIFDGFIDTLADNMENFNDSELEIIFKNLLKWPKFHKNSRNFIEVWRALDDALFCRYKEWEKNKLLLFLDYFNSLGILTCTDYPLKGICKLIRKYKNLSNDELVQTAYYISIIKIPPYDMHNLEVRFKESLDTLSIDEIAIIALAFGKCAVPLREEFFIETLIKRTIFDVSKLDDFSVYSILELLRISSRPTLNKYLEMLSDLLLKELNRFSPPTSTLIACMGVSTGLYQREMLLAAANIVINNISELNIKHYERILQAFTTFNVDNTVEETLTNAIIEELRSPRMSNISENHISCFINSLDYLTALGKFPYDLISRAFDPEFHLKSYKQNLNHGLPASRIEVAVTINCKDYNGKRMEDKRRQKVAFNYSEYIPEVGSKYKLNLTGVYMLKTMLLVEKIRGTNFSYTGYLLPNFQRADIVICNDPNGAPVEVVEHFPRKHTFGKILYAPDSINTWIALIITEKKKLCLQHWRTP